MAFVYRYIDLESQEVVYIGKVKGEKDTWNDPLRRRHEQHMRDEWYKKNADNLVMQFIEVDSHADADILETWLISQYGTGQLVNVSKTGWGKSGIDLWPQVTGKWRTYQRGCAQSRDALYALAGMLYETTEGLEYNVDSSLGMFSEMVRDIVMEKKKANRLSRYDEQDEFLRTQTMAKPGKTNGVDG